MGNDTGVHAKAEKYGSDDVKRRVLRGEKDDVKFEVNDKRKRKK